MNAVRASRHRRSGVITALALATALATLGACDSSTTFVPPSFDYTKFTFPSTTTLPPAPPPTRQTVLLDSETTIEATTTSTATATAEPPATAVVTTTTLDQTIDPVLIDDPVFVGVIPDGTPIVVDPPITPPPPPACELVNDLVAAVTGNAISSSGGEDFDEAAGHNFRKCYGSAMPPTELSGNNRSALFEAWVFAPGQLPEQLAAGTSDVLTPSAFILNDTLGVDVTSTAGSFFAAKSTSTASRAARFSCGGWECWLYLEQGAYYPGDPDLSTLDSAMSSVIDGMRTGVGLPAPASAPTDVVPPECSQLEAPVQDIIHGSFQATTFFFRQYEPYDPAASHPYVRCDGGVATKLPEGLPLPNSYIRLTNFQLFASPHEFRLTTLDSFARPTEPAPDYGDGVLAIRNPLQIVEVDANDTTRARTSLVSAFVTYDCGAWDCWLYVSEQAELPPDFSTDLFDVHVKYYVEQTRAYVSSLP